MYQHIVHRTSIPRLNLMLRDFFGIDVTQAYIHMMKALLARHFEATYSAILRRLLAGALIHGDETEVKLKTSTGYVWALTNMEEVYYFYKPSREGGFLKEMLKGFHGVLVSDFYSAYDSVPCLQQKCLVHLIRDINQELLQSPYDGQLKGIASTFGGLLRSAVDAIDRWGLRRNRMARIRKNVDGFYRFIEAGSLASEAATSLAGRLCKYREKLFTFLEHDGVPWNNNNAEHAIKQFAQFRATSDGVLSESGINDLMVLLSVCVTCKFKNVSLLRFLMSGERDIDAFGRNGLRPETQPEVELYPEGFPTRYPGQKRPRLKDVANGSTVKHLCDKAVELLRVHLTGLQPTVSGVVLTLAVGRRRLRVFSLLPRQSTGDEGLRYHVYTKRLADYLGVSCRQIEDMLPGYRRMGIARGQNGEYGGGIFKSLEEIMELRRELDEKRSSDGRS